MDSENSTGKSRPKSQRGLYLESSQRLPNLSKIRSSNFEMAVMSPMTNLVHNLSGASLDSTPKRRFLSHGNSIPNSKSCTKDNAFPVCGLYFGMVNPHAFFLCDDMWVAARKCMTIADPHVFV